ncbi:MULTISPECIES: TetR/AcrR family transcriptional regulator [Pseudomonas]|uniref:TetR/AcrR family transcriptional regulator n=1 Tax=Pseudomonas sp. KB-10 TaxID=2292264 RepID=UPI00278BEB90|nr:TetR/AcrR family transcriptional regulator [Pseudomonas yangonensis]
MPKVLTPSAANICAMAVGHFADHGYDASSLNEIAALAGMRKASLYAHFASKDALFHQVFELALAHELDHVATCFEAEAGGSAIVGLCYAQHLIGRYEQSAHLRFLLRTAFLPPAELREAVSAGYEHYLGRIRTAFVGLLRMRHAWAAHDESRVETYAEAYLGIIDSLHVELFYASPDTCKRRTVALFRLLGDSMTLAARG